MPYFSWPNLCLLPPSTPTKKKPPVPPSIFLQKYRSYHRHTGFQSILRLFNASDSVINRLRKRTDVRILCECCKPLFWTLYVNLYYVNFANKNKKINRKKFLFPSPYMTPLSLIISAWVYTHSWWVYYTRPALVGRYLLAEKQSFSLRRCFKERERKKELVSTTPFAYTQNSL